MSIISKKASSDQVKELILGDPSKDVPLMKIVPDVDEDLEDSFDEDEGEDLLYNTLMEDSESPLILDFILQELAVEVYELKQMRNTRKNVSSTQISARRVDGLKKIGDIWLKKKELNKKTHIDIKSPEFQNILESLLSKIHFTMESVGFTKEQNQVFFTKLSQNLKTWEEELTKMMVSKKTEEHE